VKVAAVQRRFLFSATIKVLLAASSWAAFANRALATGGVLPALGEAAPEFDLQGINKQGALQRKLADLRGKWLVLYFYPKDFTSGCTLEARGFQKDLVSFRKKGAEIIGISADDPDQHASFCGSEGLTYTLLSDPDGSVSRAYGSWLAPFSQRHTFLIDPNGIMKARWTAVQPSGHSQEVLIELEKLQA
jgi:peroxiredoxin Q/BCP